MVLPVDENTGELAVPQNFSMIFHRSRSSHIFPRSRRCWYYTQPRPGVRKHYKNNLSFPSDSSGEVCSHYTHATYPRSASHPSLHCWSSCPSRSSFTPLSWPPTASSRCSPIIISSPSPLSLAFFSYCSSSAQPWLTCYALPCITASASLYLLP